MNVASDASSPCFFSPRINIRALPASKRNFVALSPFGEDREGIQQIKLVEYRYKKRDSECLAFVSLSISCSVTDLCYSTLSCFKYRVMCCVSVDVVKHLADLWEVALLASFGFVRERILLGILKSFKDPFN
jgi:hypothetical protein